MTRRVWLGALTLLLLGALTPGSAEARPVLFRPEFALTLDPIGAGYTRLKDLSALTLNMAGALDIRWPYVTIGVTGAGAVAEDFQSVYVGGHLGLALDWRRVRIELLGEVGGHRLAFNTGAATEPSSWLPYAGVSPTVTFKLPSRRLPLMARIQVQALFDLQQRLSATDAVSPLTPVYFGGNALLVTAGLGLNF